MFTIFVLDDEPWYGTMIQHYLSQNSEYNVQRFEHATELLAQLHKKPDAITVDFAMPGINGQEAMQLIRKQMPKVPIIIISGQEDIQTAISLLKDGAFDYILKDEDTNKRLLNTLHHIHEIKLLKKQLEGLKNEVVRMYDFSNTMLGKSPAMQKVFDLTKRAALTNITVSITGESGTGKELVAKSIHYNSSRQKEPFVVVNIGSIPKHLMESELFGHEKGALPGALSGRMGRLEEANNGTILINEITELDVTTQSKLLRFLQDKVICRIGSNNEIPINVRIMISTCDDLKVAVNNKTFREDLYYRLLGLPIVIPPLRERGDDVLFLAKLFVDDFCKHNMLTPKQLSNSAKNMLSRYKYPGNVRELKSLIELAVVLCSDDVIESHDINLQEGSSIKSVIEKEKTLKEYEHEIVQHYLEKYEGNVIQVAEKLAIGKSTLYRMLKTQLAN